MNSGNMSSEGLLIVRFKLFFDLYGMLILISHLLNNFGLLDLFLVLLALQIFSLMLLIC